MAASSKIAQHPATVSIQHIAALIGGLIAALALWEFIAPRLKLPRIV